MPLNSSGAPPETKVVAQGTYGLFTGMLVAIITTYVFKGHVPTDLQAILPVLIGSAVGAVAGWFSKHTPRLGEDVTAFDTYLQGSGYVTNAQVEKYVGEVVTDVVKRYGGGATQPKHPIQVTGTAPTSDSTSWPGT